MVQIKSSKKTTLSMLEEPEHPNKFRTYLGMSLIGHTCSRYIWYTFRWAYDSSHSDRLRRLFKRGHREEPEIIKELNRIGIEVHSDQLEFVSCFGHSKGHCDGIAEGVIEAPTTPHLAEFKTMSDKYFKELVKLKLKLAKPIYYGQVQYGMHHYGLKRALFVAVNKNDDSYYVERIKYDVDYAVGLVAKAKAIILSAEPPIKTFKPTWYECKFCDARFICHFGTELSKNCRTCQHVALAHEGGWVCEVGNQIGGTEVKLSADDQRTGCLSHLPIENF